MFSLTFKPMTDVASKCRFARDELIIGGREQVVKDRRVRTILL